MPSPVTVFVRTQFGGCTLRAAIEEANATPGPDTIGFSLGESSQFTISPTTALPAITETVTIDGYTHPGATENTSAFGDNANLVIQLSGDSSPGSIGLDLSASTGSVVRGLVVNGFERGIQAGEGSVIAGNFVGTDFAGTSAIGNIYGIGVEDVGNVTIGGTTPAARNLISGNSIGILANGNVDDSSILGNYIGTSRSGDTSVSNTTGISLAERRVRTVPRRVPVSQRQPNRRRHRCGPQRDLRQRLGGCPTLEQRNAHRHPGQLHRGRRRWCLPARQQRIRA